MYTLSKYIYIQLDSCIQYVYTHVSPGLCVLLPQPCFACRGTSLRGPSSAKTAVGMSWRRRCSDGAIEGGNFGAPKFPFFPTTKSMVKSDVFLFPGLETIHFFLILVSYHLDLLKVIHTISLV